MVVGTFQFFRQNTWFLENNRALSKSLYGVLHYLINIIKYQSIKNNFILTTRATLKQLLIFPYLVSGLKIFFSEIITLYLTN